MKPAAHSLLLASMLALPVEFADAMRLSLQGKLSHSQRLASRASLSGTTALSDSSNMQYTTNITLNGAQFSVITDTGSSDLWVAGSVPNAANTGKTTTVQYVIGSARGSVQTATLDFAGYTVDNQAFMTVSPDSSHAAGTGLIGLGPNSGSRVSVALGNQPQGYSVLDRIFLQNTSTPNFITVLLGRDDDPGKVFPGDLTVAEVLPGYEAITSQPQLPVSIVPTSDSTDQHWQTLLDADGIIGPYGKAVDVNTVVTATQNPKQLTAAFDSGYSIPQVPSAVASQIYSDISGAKLVNDPNLGSIWTVPCNVEINISFNIGGKNFPIHPLDTSLDFGNTDARGNKICYGGFQPISDAGESPTYDMILGMAFLRNAYISLNLGDFVNGNTSQTAPPYIQLLSITNSTTTTHDDFTTARGAATPVGAVARTGISVNSWFRLHFALAIALAATFGVLLLLAVGFTCYRMSRSRRMRRTPAGFRSFQSSYRPIGTQAPQAAYEVQSAGRYAPFVGPPPGNPGNYNRPWNAR